MKLNQLRALAGLPIYESKSLDKQIEAFAKEVGAKVESTASGYSFTGDKKAMERVRDYFSSDQDDEEGDPGVKRYVGKIRAESAFRLRAQHNSDRD